MKMILEILIQRIRKEEYKRLLISFTPKFLVLKVTEVNMLLKFNAADISP